MTDAERWAQEALPRLSAAERDQLAIRALVLSAADSHSLYDLAHREYVHGVIAGASPTIFRALSALLRATRRLHDRQPLHREPGR